MVACTSLGYPCQEGADAPCDMSEIWCAFTAAVEADLAEIGEAAQRSVVSAPLAKVYVNNLEYATGDVAVEAAVEFDAVFSDNDNMVDLASDPALIQFRRPGLYQIEANITGLSSEVGFGWEAVLVVRRFGLPNIEQRGSVYWRSGTTTARAMGFVEIPAAAFVDGQPLPNVRLNIDFYDRVGGYTVTVTEADMSAAWFADEVV